MLHSQCIHSGFLNTAHGFDLRHGTPLASLPRVLRHYAHADGAGRDDDVHRYIRKRRKLERETENARYEQMNHRDYEFTLMMMILRRVGLKLLTPLIGEHETKICDSTFLSVLTQDNHHRSEWHSFLSWPTLLASLATPRPVPRRQGADE